MERNWLCSSLFIFHWLIDKKSDHSLRRIFTIIRFIHLHTGRTRIFSEGDATIRNGMTDWRGKQILKVKRSLGVGRTPCILNLGQKQLGDVSCITYTASLLINVGKYHIFFPQNGKNHLIINNESGGWENLLHVSTLLSGIAPLDSLL